MTKVYKLVNNCTECPNRHYYSAGAHECLPVQQLLPSDHRDRIPEWCPLPNYPAGVTGRPANVACDANAAELRCQWPDCGCYAMQGPGWCKRNAGVGGTDGR